MMYSEGAEAFLPLRKKKARYKRGVLEAWELILRSLLEKQLGLFLGVVLLSVGLHSAASRTLSVGGPAVQIICRIRIGSVLIALTSEDTSMGNVLGK